jgi:protocatechuate 3,4-dioxygenase beta subunit
MTLPHVWSGRENIVLAQSMAGDSKCPPTQPDYLGPFYKAGSPERTSVGTGYELTGVVRSAANCTPIENARIELWLTNPEGEYDDDHRATLYSDGAGNYRFKSNFPPGYSGRPPHIHIKISADGFKTLATQHYPSAGSKSGVFDIVLIPAP